MKKMFCLILIIVWLAPSVARAAAPKDTYPRLANYFLKWEISDQEAVELSKWDVLVLDMETQETSRPQLLKIRALNPRIIMVAYVTPEEIASNAAAVGGLRARLAAGMDDGWWLRDGSGRKLSNWPGTFMLNVSDAAATNAAGQHWNDYLVNFVVREIKGSGLWDGVFYDNVWSGISWLNQGDIDINNDGQRDSAAALDDAWSKGMEKILAETRALAGSDFLILANGQPSTYYLPQLNGLMLEQFPSTWGDTWTTALQLYSRSPALNLPPSLPILNVTDKNQENYRHFRYGLASALLGDGFYSFDYDITDHGQTWWYDEYDWNLGTAESAPYNLLASSSAGAASSAIQPGLWRRDFKNGLALVNSTAVQQTYIFSKEEVEKIKGDQDAAINTGQEINYVQLAPQDGLILLKKSLIVEDNPFTNGYFFRYFDINGQQVRNGFFPFVKSLPGEAEVIIASSGDLSLSAAAGELTLYQGGEKLWSIFPFSKSYQGPLSLAAEVEQGTFPTIIVGAGRGGGPQVRIINGQGRLIGSFFAYDKNLRGGVNVALADVNGDGREEIITGPGPGEEPRLKIFSLTGQLQNSWLAYDAKMRGGVNVATGDVDGDGRPEIISAPAGAGGPQIRIFSGAGRVLGGFFAYDQTYHGGLKVTVSNTDTNGRAEILAGLKNFY